MAAAWGLAGAATPEALEAGRAFALSNRPDAEALEAESVPGFESAATEELEALREDSAALEEAGARALGESEAGRLVTETLDRPVFEFDPETDPLLLNAQRLSDEATAGMVGDGVSERFPGCSVAVSRPGWSVRASCTAIRPVIAETCERVLRVEVSQEPTCTHGEPIGEWSVAIEQRVRSGAREHGRAGVRVLCDLAAARRGRVLVETWALGSVSHLLDTREIELDMAPHTGRNLPEALTTHWNDRYFWTALPPVAATVDVEESGGCSGGECGYVIRFRQRPLFWWSSPSAGTSVTLRFEQPRFERVERDVWDGSCALLEARSR